MTARRDSFAEVERRFGSEVAHWLRTYPTLMEARTRTIYGACHCVRGEVTPSGERAVCTSCWCAKADSEAAEHVLVKAKTDVDYALEVAARLKGSESEIRNGWPNLVGAGR
jgi:hypothetical protein